ncbi:hypothetical protein L2E82_13691 [Cichorium intybus]|uniref:Uncharacterized protein n=1 Tax=Cichorium intybus TaxID=13427 RepID=A0ACB9EXW9_CICIN|nr:hypothetical protein L2E82_13691 [Cichorium intybus]
MRFLNMETGNVNEAQSLDQNIDNEIMGSNIKEWNPNLNFVHAQDSVMESVIVGVTGSLTDNDNVAKYIAAKEGSVAATPQTPPNTVAKSYVLLMKPLTLPSNDVLETMYDVKSIYIKDLPPKMTQVSLLEVVKRFGPIKNKNVQIKEYSEV